MTSQIAPSGVLNTYASITELKTRLGIGGAAGDGPLWNALYAASRAVDAYCNRHFYSRQAVRIFDVTDTAQLTVPDLISITSLREDADGDRVFETVRETSDYVVTIVDTGPQALTATPITRIVADPQGPRPAFTPGLGRVQVDGEWGYRAHTLSTGAVLSAGGPVGAASEVAPISDASLIEAGQTLLIDSEQAFVKLVSNGEVTLTRGVNGTSAVSHADGVDLQAYQYVPEIVEATLVLASRMWKRKDLPFGLAGAATSGVPAARDPDVVALVSPYRRLALGVSV